MQKALETLIDEAAWRQPAVILLDDLDVIAGAASGPEAEMSGESLYAAKVAESKVPSIISLSYYLPCSSFCHWSCEVCASN